MYKSSVVRVDNINLVDLRICEVGPTLPQLPKCSNRGNNTYMKQSNKYRGNGSSSSRGNGSNRSKGFRMIR
jgi:hypothetical protein